MTIDKASELADGSKYNNCGDYWTTCLFFVFYQVRINKGREVEREMDGDGICVYKRVLALGLTSQNR